MPSYHYSDDLMVDGMIVIVHVFCRLEKSINISWNPFQFLSLSLLFPHHRQWVGGLSKVSPVGPGK